MRLVTISSFIFFVCFDINNALAFLGGIILMENNECNNLNERNEERKIGFEINNTDSSRLHDCVKREMIN
jgi:hypothetical protein